MSSNNESVQKTITVALVLCLVCAVVVSSAAVILRPAQAVNEKANMQMNILQAAGLYDPQQSIQDQFQIVTTRLVNLETGEFVEGMDAERYNQRKASKDPSMNRVLSGEEDIASIKRQAKIAKIYLIENGDQIEKIILPIHGYGLWSTLYGFMALEGDGNTVAGLGFYEHAETPGLGGEVDNPNWKAQWTGKQVYNGDAVALRLVKGGADRSDSYGVDALSGATLTSRGVDNLLKFWMSDAGFKPFLDNLKQGRI
ncbi:MAG: Na(+)-translocating NADH-quinone reductase subunit C [Gammaproteobacteria bacterium]|nr:Na(+)-translocating NADH-quinone reductase subunit C [Gammaproteobacteria bacterium]NCW09365.1 Na(+)-translocating NADH-quinone reductase subunit C [Gammaproteobacteria bacterium]NCW74286.1 Na(+)-translocating NADH-quinone reductase subunit C [Gammaproteobacteria bacterium]NCX49005.1 Na(+)-translocating NADH-quinone reductase subunit C [Gammaproteobacteria bacterium]